MKCATFHGSHVTIFWALGNQCAFMIRCNAPQSCDLVIYLFILVGFWHFLMLVSGKKTNTTCLEEWLQTYDSSIHITIVGLLHNHSELLNDRCKKYHKIRSDHMSPLTYDCIMISNQQPSCNLGHKLGTTGMASYKDIFQSFRLDWTSNPLTFF